jgi:CTP synthase
VLYIHVTLVPYLSSAAELKTKPTQHSVNELRRIGIQPDIIIARSDRPLGEEIKRKIALFCDIEPTAVISAVDTDNIYEIPLMLHREGFDEIVVKRLKLPQSKPELTDWVKLVTSINGLKRGIKIGLVGKYIKLPDAYLSVVESLKHGGFYHNAEVKVSWIDAETLSSEEVKRCLAVVDGILVPGGFGVRGIEGKIRAVTFARESNIPFLGICLGLQCAVVEFARNVVGLRRANSSEFDLETPHPVIDLMPAQKEIKSMGGTMRLGAYPCHLKEGTKAGNAYKQKIVYERHRHRYEVNPNYHEKLSQAGLVFSGLSPDGELVEIVEIPEHRWFVATQFHPEFKSRPTRPHPLFREFIGAALQYHLSKEKLTVTSK